MEDLEIKDDAYKDFLRVLSTADSLPNDDNDSEYVYNDDIFSHGWKFDLDEIQYKTLHAFPSTTSNSDVGESHVEASSINLFRNVELARIFNQQLRQHVQLLTQTYLLAKNGTHMVEATEEIRTHLTSYKKIFQHKRKPSNLVPALNLVNNIKIKDVKSSTRLTWRPLPLSDCVKRTIRDNPNIFIYPSLYPQVAFSIVPRVISKKSKINFTINEDKLLAYALYEFKNELSMYPSISTLLMPAKSKTQIINHIKNIKRSPMCADNPLRVYLINNILPEIDHKEEIVSIEDTSIQYPDLSSYETADQTKPSTPELLKDVDPQNVELNIKKDEEEQQQPQRQRQQQQQHHVRLHSNPGEDLIETDMQKLDEEQELDEETEVPSQNEMYRFETSDMFCDNAMDIDALMTASTTIIRNIHDAASNSASMAMMSSQKSQSRDRQQCNLDIPASNEVLKDVLATSPEKSKLDPTSLFVPFTKSKVDSIISRFMKQAEDELDDGTYVKLLEFLRQLECQNLCVEEGSAPDELVIDMYNQIINFLKESNASQDLQDMAVLFLTSNQAFKCGRSFEYLHWMRVFQFMNHVTQLCTSDQFLKKKTTRLIDALQKRDLNRVKFIMGTIIQKNTFLKKELDSLFLTSKPYQNFEALPEDYEDITDSVLLSESTTEQDKDALNYEHFSLGITENELSYGSSSCSCACHTINKLELSLDRPSGSDQATISVGRHCENCNLKFINRKLYLVGRKKPILAEWSFMHNKSETEITTDLNIPSNQEQEAELKVSDPELTSTSPIENKSITQLDWTYEEDMEIMEFSKLKASNDEDVSFSANTFQELVDIKFDKRRSASDVAERFNQLLELYIQNSIKPSA